MVVLHLRVPLGRAALHQVGGDVLFRQRGRVRIDLALQPTQRRLAAALEDLQKAKEKTNNVYEEKKSLVVKGPDPIAVVTRERFRSMEAKKYLENEKVGMSLNNC